MVAPADRCHREYRTVPPQRRQRHAAIARVPGRYRSTHSEALIVRYAFRRRAINIPMNPRPNKARLPGSERLNAYVRHVKSRSDLPNQIGCSGGRIDCVESGDVRRSPRLNKRGISGPGNPGYIEPNIVGYSHTERSSGGEHPIVRRVLHQQLSDTESMSYNVVVVAPTKLLV